MTDALEKLKDPFQIVRYQYRSDEEKSLLCRAAKANQVKVLTPKGFLRKEGTYFDSSEYFLIDAGWQPGPEFEYVLIEEHNGMLGIRNDDVEGKGRPYPLSSSSGFVYLYIIPSIPSFVKFVDEEKKGLVFAEVVARRWRRGDLTYAQFIKGAE